MCIGYFAESSIATRGSTVDTTAYSVSGVHPQSKLREVKPSSCVQADAILVNKAAEEDSYRNPAAELSDDQARYFMKKATDDDFENTAKAFKDVESKGSMDIGESQYTIPAAGIKRGRMTLDG